MEPTPPAVLEVLRERVEFRFQRGRLQVGEFVVDVQDGLTGRLQERVQHVGR